MSNTSKIIRSNNKYYIAVNQKQSSAAINKYGLLEIIIVDNKEGGECTASQIDECDKTIVIPTTTPSVQLYDIPN